MGASWGASRRHLGTRWGARARERAKRAKRAERRHAVPSRPRRSDGTAIKRQMRKNRERGREEDKMLLEVFHSSAMLPRAFVFNALPVPLLTPGFKRGFRSSKTPSGGLQDVPKTPQDASKMPPRGLLFCMCFSMPFWIDF